MTWFLITDYEVDQYDIASERRFNDENQQEATEYMIELARKHNLEYTVNGKCPRKLLD